SSSTCETPSLSSVIERPSRNSMRGAVITGLLAQRVAAGRGVCRTPPGECSPTAATSLIIGVRLSSAAADPEGERPVAGVGLEPAGEGRRLHVVLAETVQRQPGGAGLQAVRLGALPGLLPLREPAPVGHVHLVERAYRGTVADAVVGHQLEQARHLVHLDEGADLLAALADQGGGLFLPVLLPTAGQLEHLVAGGVHVPVHEHLPLADDQGLHGHARPAHALASAPLSPPSGPRSGSASARSTAARSRSASSSLCASSSATAVSSRSRPIRRCSAARCSRASVSSGIATSRTSTLPPSAPISPKGTGRARVASARPGTTTCCGSACGIAVGIGVGSPVG